MKPSTIAVVAALAIAGGGGLAFLLTRKHEERPAPVAAAPTTGGEPTGPLLPRGPSTDLGTGTGSGSSAPADPGAAAPPVEGTGVRVVRGETVATVNGVAITGADLLAFRANAGEALEMTPEMHEFLVKRAIERELTFQAAKARKLELTAAQKDQLAQVRANAEQRGETDPAQLAFEQKDAQAQLLLESMASADGAPPAMVDDAAVDKYLHDHAAELGRVPSDPQAAQQQRIELRQKLAGEQAAAHEAKLRELLERLERDARITR